MNAQAVEALIEKLKSPTMNWSATSNSNLVKPCPSSLWRNCRSLDRPWQS